MTRKIVYTVLYCLAVALIPVFCVFVVVDGVRYDPILTSLPFTRACCCARWNF